jgi:o-succinylbenzoate---CoA ligase
VMSGYAGHPDATAEAITDGWLKTGDIGRVDGDGYLYVLDRRDDLIITGGENVYPAEVEAVLASHPMVIEAGVIGIPDEEWGQSIVAIVRLQASDMKDGEAIAQLDMHCRSRLARYKIPSRIRIFTDPLPRTTSGKLRRSALRNLTR